MENARAHRRAGILAQHFVQDETTGASSVAAAPCLSYQSPEANEGAWLRSNVVFSQTAEYH